MRVEEALNEGINTLGAPSDREATAKVRLLLQHVLQIDGAGIIGRGGEEMDPSDLVRFRDLVDQAQCRPVYRIIGAREFHGLSLRLNEATLEPRDDTEALIDLVLEMIGPRRRDNIRFADLGTGTGAIALALLSELPQAHAVATDLAADALQMAALNADNLGYSARFDTVLSSETSWTDCLDGRFDFIVSNPPYIKRKVIEELDEMVRLHDPRLALDGGEDGLDAYKAILTAAAQYLKPDGFVGLEIGCDQKREVTDVAQSCGWKLTGCCQDLGGNDRALAFSR